MPFIADRVFDLGLNVLDTEATTLHICSSEPASFAAVAGVSLGNSAITVGAPADRTPSGRRVTVAAITAGTVTGTATASHWAIVDTPNSRLLATGSLSASQGVSSGNTFTLAAFDIGIPDAA